MIIGLNQIILRGVIREMNIKIINQAVNVKNAKLVKDLDSGTYHLIHYDTEIMQVDKENNIKRILPVTNSSQKAIIQAFEFLRLDDNIQRYDLLEQECLRLNGITVKRLRYEWKNGYFNKVEYEHSTDKNYSYQWEEHSKNVILEHD